MILGFGLAAQSLAALGCLVTLCSSRFATLCKEMEGVAFCKLAKEAVFTEGVDTIEGSFRAERTKMIRGRRVFLLEMAAVEP